MPRSRAWRCAEARRSAPRRSSRRRRSRSWRSSTASSRRRRRELLRGARSASGSSTPAPRSTSCEGTREVREGDWTVAPEPDALQNRRVEITGPTERKMVINALNSGANGFMADFEDSNSPTWSNMVGRPGEPGGRRAPHDRVHEPRGQGVPPGGRARHAARAPARLAPARAPPAGGRRAGRRRAVDFGLYLFHNARELLERGAGPYFYLPKLESHLEARLWNDVFCAAQDALGHRARHDQGHRPDRDAPGGLRDGRDPLRAARALRRAQRRALGLHLQHDQALPHRARVRAAGPRRGEDDRAVHARLHRAAGQDLPPARRPRHGRDGGA